ncbi:MAG: hypothetical protein AMXMBFR46_03210 [Acidimicrobiia bacterium]
MRRARGCGEHHSRSPIRAAGTLALVAPVLEDERGVDRQQIRELLALSPAQRVDRLVRTVGVWSEILAAAGTSRTGR